MIAIRRRISTPFSGVSGIPATVAEPEVGAMSVPSVRTVVVLPAPFGPEETEDLAAPDLERDVVEGDAGRRTLREVLDRHRRLALASAGVLHIPVAHGECRVAPCRRVPAVGDPDTALDMGCISCTVPLGYITER